MDNNFDQQNYNGYTSGNTPNDPIYTQPNEANYFSNPEENQAGYNNQGYNNQSYNNNTYYDQNQTPPYYGNSNYGFQQTKQANGMAIASLVLGIVSIVISCIWGFGIITGILAIIFGIISKSRTETGPSQLSGAAIAGIICGAVGIVLSILFFLMAALLILKDPEFLREFY